jgi:hypothetical protein
MPIDDHGSGPGPVLMWIERKFGTGPIGLFLGLLWCLSVPIMIVIALFIVGSC